MNIVKLTNGTDNNSPTGPVVPVGSTVTFTYIVTNSGNVPLSNLSVTDDKGVTPVYQSGDTDGDSLLDVTETWTYTASTTATAGQYENTGTVTGNPVDEQGTDIPGLTDQTDSDIDHHFGATAGVNIVKLTNGTDNNSPTGPVVPVGSTVTFTYIVTNSGNVPLADVSVVDDVLGAVTNFVGGDTDNDGLLDLTETWTYTASTTATAGQYENTGTVTGNPVDEQGTDIPGLTDQTDSDIDHHFGANPDIKIVKYVNGDDADTPTGPHVPVGSTVTFTYIVTNTGNVPLSNVSVTDDKLGTITSFTGDTDNDGLLDLTETWTFTKTATALAGQQTNIGTVSGTDTNTNQTVTDDNPANYFGDQLAKIDIEKYVKSVGVTTGGEGLTPGYWKQTQHFDTWVATGYNPSDSFNTIFGVNDPDNPTLLQALQTGGGGFDALGRHAVAALLNSAHPNIEYAYTTAQVIAKVQSAYANPSTVETIKDQLAVENEREADLSTSGGMTVSGPGQDADTAPGLVVEIGSQVEFTYFVTNPGEVPLSNVVVTDDNATPGDTSDDFHPVYVGGDTDNDGLLDVGETWQYTAGPQAVTSGQHTNIAIVTGTPVGGGSQVTDSDAANWYGGFVPEGSISGKKFLDDTGNGLTADDTGQSGVTIYLDANNNSMLDNGETSTTTDDDGTYSFTGLTPGTYIVREVVPNGYVRTGPTTTDFYSVTLATGQTVTGKDFANAEVCDRNVLSCIQYFVTHNGVTATYTDLRGHVSQGDTVRVKFYYNGSQAHDFSLVSYTAPGSSFDANTASQQEIFQNSVIHATGSGWYTSDAVVVPNCYFQIDFVCGLPIDHFGPAGSNIFYSPQNRLFSADNGGTQVCGATSVSGFVYADLDNDGEFDSNEVGIVGVPVKLIGAGADGNFGTADDTTATTTTDGDGFYQFTGLAPGMYKILETQPTAYNDGKETLGTGATGATGASILTNDIFKVDLNAYDDAINFNFGEITPTTGGLRKGDTATIGYWHNKNGRALIKGFGKTDDGRTLGQWLADTFPNLYGDDSDNNLRYKSNSKIADVFLDLFKVRGQKTEAQTLAVAFAIYATTDSLGGGWASDAQGFNVSTLGTGSRSYNVGSYGSAIGLTNNGTYTIFFLLKQADLQKMNGTFDANAFNSIFDGINTSGDR